MLHRIWIGLLGCAALAVAGGGLHLFVGDPAASSDQAAKGGLVLIEVQGCAKPEDTRISAVAKSLNGTVSVPVQLDVVNLKQPGRMVLKSDAVRAGQWAVIITAKNGAQEHVSNVTIRDGAFVARK